MCSRCESGKPNPYEQKYVMTEVQGKICLRCISQENPTYVRRNPSWRRHKAKCAQGVRVKKIQPA
ncbi:hypothetical protein BHE74_00029689 [Ensete ventricosum]|nr:hypothetical protein BHE74_00029689 [Ensete ventricosum]